MSVILLVNDYPPHAALVALQAILLNYQVVTAKDAVDAVEIAQKLRPILVILDINLGEKGKIEGLPLLRERDDLRQIPLLVISGSHEPDDAERALAAGAAEVLIKPFEVEQFKQAVQRCLAQ